MVMVCEGRGYTALLVVAMVACSSNRVMVGGDSSAGSSTGTDTAPTGDGSTDDGADGGTTDDDGTDSEPGGTTTPTDTTTGTTDVGPCGPMPEEEYLQPSWVTRIVAEQDLVRVFAVAIDDEGGIWATGPDGNVGEDVGWVARLSDSGTQQWIDLLAEQGRDVALDGQGNAVVVFKAAYGVAFARYDKLGTQLQIEVLTGYRPYAVDLDAYDNMFVSIGGFVDDTLIKYDAEGWVLWSHLLHDEDLYNSAHDLVVDSQGDVVVAGDLVGTGLWTRKYSADGDILWDVREEPNDHSVGERIGVDANDDVLVAGEDQHDDGLVRKYSSDGVLQWTFLYDGLANHWDRAYDIAVSPDGTSIVVGTTVVDAWMAPCEGEPEYDCEYESRDAWIAKLGVDGCPLWVRLFDAEETDSGMAVASRDGDSFVIAVNDLVVAYQDE